MPWNDNSGNGNAGGPWGQRPSGGRGPRGSGPQPTDFEDMIQKGRDRMRQAFPSGQLPGSAWLIGILLVVLVWLATGIYTVQQDQQGVVLRFGKAVRTTEPGLHYHLPYPIETVERPQVTKNNAEIIGEIVNGRRNEIQGHMLTRDENIAYVEFSVNWRIQHDKKFDNGLTGTFLYLFNIQDPEESVRAVAESAMREVVGRNTMEFVRTKGRDKVQQETQEITQRALDEYGAGILITQVQVKETPPPKPVEESFLDLNAARQNKERSENQALRYQNRVIPEARGQAFRIIQEAEAYRQQTVEQALGQANRFNAIYSVYKDAKSVTRERMFLETMERVLAGKNKVVIDQNGSGSGVVPYLPLNELSRPARNQEDEEEQQQ